MAPTLFYNEICEAVRGLVQGGVGLTATTSGSDTVTVGSNRLFTVGQTVVLTDTAGQSETHTVAALVGLTGVQLSAAVQATFSPAQGAMLALDPPALGAASGGLKWIGQGQPELMPQPPATQLPCVIIAPGRMDQPPAAGTNCAWRQDYRIQVYYLDRPMPGSVSGLDLLTQADALFGLLSSDPYLGGAAWYAQVLAVEPDPLPVRQMRAAGAEVVGVMVEVLAERLS
jgi:hypothetical protein